MSLIVTGPKKAVLSQDNEGYREYKVTYEVLETTGAGVGPAAAIQCPGLPAVGSYWLVEVGPGGATDVDVYAYCKMGPTQVKSMGPDDEWSDKWDVTLTFSSKPDNKRCRDQHIEDPLLMPDRISFTFNKFTEEAIRDRFGNPIMTSSFEQLRGQQVEFDANRGITVTIEQNRANLELPLITTFNNTLNASTLWGCPPRTIKFTLGTCTEKYYGTCFKYYERQLHLEIAFDGWDRDVLDEGTKCLKGKWETNAASPNYGHWVLVPIGGVTPNRYNPSHFDRFIDKTGNPTKCVLDGAGLPFDPDKPIPLSFVDTGLKVTKKAYDSAGVLSAPVLAGTMGPDMNFGGLNVGYEYWWVMTAIDSAGKESDPSNILKLSPTNGNQTATLTWGAVAGAVGYKFYRKRPGFDFDFWFVGAVGRPFSAAGNVHVEKYGESDLLQLGIPAVLGP